MFADRGRAKRVLLALLLPGFLWPFSCSAYGRRGGRRKAKRNETLAITCSAGQRSLITISPTSLAGVTPWTSERWAVQKLACATACGCLATYPILHDGGTLCSAHYLGWYSRRACARYADDFGRLAWLGGEYRSMQTSFLLYYYISLLARRFGVGAGNFKRSRMPSSTMPVLSSASTQDVMRRPSSYPSDLRVGDVCICGEQSSTTVHLRLCTGWWLRNAATCYHHLFLCLHLAWLKNGASGG